MITADEFFMGRDKKYPLTDKQKNNALMFLDAVNRLLAHYKKDVIVTSGYRPLQINNAVGGAKKSKHVECLAIDLADGDGAIDKWLMENEPLLKQLGLYVEHHSCTPGWAHIQLGAPLSGARYFMVKRPSPLLA